MTDENTAMIFEATVPASAERVYRAFTNSQALRGWLCDIATVSPREGGHIYLGWNEGYYAAGAYNELVGDERVAFSWQGKGYPAESAVIVKIEPASGPTRVIVEHTTPGLDGDWKQIRLDIAEGWRSSLDNLVTVLTTGEDERFTKRPMLGIIPDELDETIAADLGLPVSEGIRLSGVVDGMSAQAAGLQVDDVIVAIGGAEVVDYPTLQAALGGRRAGETVTVDYYRGPDSLSIDMALTGRPLPDMPQTTAELAAVAEERYAQNNEELGAFFTGVSEDEANYKPAADAWSAAETLAHLLHVERDYQLWIAEVVAGHESWTENWQRNPNFQNAATVAAYTSLEDMIEATITARAETVALFRNMPDAVTERKGTFWRLAYGVADVTYDHQAAHLAQMEAAISDYRAQDE